MKVEINHKKKEKNTNTIKQCEQSVTQQSNQEINLKNTCKQMKMKKWYKIFET